MLEVSFVNAAEERICTVDHGNILVGYAGIKGGWAGVGCI